MNSLIYPEINDGLNICKQLYVLFVNNKFTNGYGAIVNYTTNSLPYIQFPVLINIVIGRLNKSNEKKSYLFCHSRQL